MSRGVIAVSTYRCSICQTTYSTKKAATECYAKGIDKPKLKVGDVTKAGSFGWFDGDPRWVVNYKERASLGNTSIKTDHGDNRNCFGPCCTFQFFYVVTRVDKEQHRYRYHLFTKAMSGKEGYQSGYTYDWGHKTVIPLKKVPKAILADSKDLLGQGANGLL